MWQKICLLVLSCSLLANDADARLRKRIKPKQYTPQYSSVVMDADTGEILHNEDANGIRHPASLTKMMTLYMVFEALKAGRISLKTKIPVSAKASRQAPSKLGLTPGETISIKTAILGLVTKSANDVAVVVAEFLGGSEEAFARQMTQKARALGMSNTVFRNASGLPDLAQVTSAKDMAILSRALYQDYPNQYKYFSLRSFNHKGTEHRNHNHLLGKVAGVDGIKTGFIGASGFNLAASAVRLDKYDRPHRLITVVMGGANRHWRDRRVTELLETHFSKEGAHRHFTETIDDSQLNELIYEEHDDTFEQVAVEPLSNQSIDNLLHEVTVEESEFAMLETLGTSQSVSKIEINVDQIPDPISRKAKTLPTNWVVPSTASNLAKTRTSPPSPSKPKATAPRTLQLTTVSSEKKARDLAQSAHKKIGLGRVKVQKINRGKRTLFSPQITGIPANKAGNACKMIVGKCVVLS